MSTTPKGPSKRVQSCAQCGHFCDDPEELEKLFKGILILSSTYGSTRGKAGVCGIDGNFHDPEEACADFVARPEPQKH